jgi:hypothetical protein
MWHAKKATPPFLSWQVNSLAMHGAERSWLIDFTCGVNSRKYEIYFVGRLVKYSGVGLVV